MNFLTPAEHDKINASTLRDSVYKIVQTIFVGKVSTSKTVAQILIAEKIIQKNNTHADLMDLAVGATNYYRLIKNDTPPYTILPILRIMDTRLNKFNDGFKKEKRG